MLLKHLKEHSGMVVTWFYGAWLHLSVSWLFLSLFTFLKLSYFQEFLYKQENINLNFFSWSG